MTSHLEAHGDTGVERARDECVDALVDWSVMPPGSGLHVREILDDFEAAVRAQVDDDVRRLVGASQVAIAAVVRSTEYDTVPHEAELSLALHNLRAALEPFKAVAPTADVEEVERGG